MSHAFVGFAGVMGDRAYAFVRVAGPKGFPWHTGREQEDLVLYRPRYREAGGATLPIDVESSFAMAPGAPMAIVLVALAGRYEGVGEPLSRASGQAAVNPRLDSPKKGA